MSEFIKTYAGKATGEKKIEIEERTLRTSRSISIIVLLYTVFDGLNLLPKRHHNNVNSHELDLTGADYLLEGAVCIFFFPVSIFTLLLFTFKHKISLSLNALNRVKNSELKLTHCDTWWNVNEMTVLPFRFLSFSVYDFQPKIRKANFNRILLYFCHVHDNSDIKKKEKGNKLFPLIPLIWSN